MQLTLLQEDLFSAAGEALAPAPKKSKTAKISAVKPAKESVPALEVIDPPVAAPIVVAVVAPAAEVPVIKIEIPAATVSAPAKTEPKPVQAAEPLGEKAPNAFKTISEVADFLGLPQHVLRFWESRFSQIKPLKLRGGRRYYRPDDIEILSTIKHLLYKQGYTINGAKKAFSSGKNAVIRDVYAQENKQETPKPSAAKVNEKQKQQLANIRQELFALRETLRPYTTQNA